MNNHLALLDYESDDTRWPLVWFAIAQHPWSSLVLVPADERLSVLPMARALTAAARMYEERPVSLIEAEHAAPSDVRAITANVRDYASQGQRIIVAVRSPLVSHPATPIARACDAAILLIPLGQTKMAAAKQVIATVGHTAFLGAFTVAMPS
jgi:hypothetical protein